MRSFILTTLLLVSCGSHGSSPVSPTPTSSIEAKDADFYVSKFEEMAKQHLGPDYKVTTTIEMVEHLTDDGKEVGGVCYANEHKITVNSTLWDYSSGTIRQVVIFHELGHCELYRPHLDTLKIDGTKVSLMSFAGLYEPGLYDDNQDYYNTELFSVDNRPKEKVEQKPADPAQPTAPKVEEPKTYQISYRYEVQSQTMGWIGFTSWKGGYAESDQACHEQTDTKFKLVTVDKATFDSKAATCTKDSDTRLTCNVTGNTTPANGNCCYTVPPMGGSMQYQRCDALTYDKHVEPKL